ncbi:MAG: hypothetical protein ABI852_00840 [Gemmatimonadaceae bacterium]
MANIVVVHHGLGLWVNRGNFWEILFPDAEQMVAQDGISMLQAHEPALCVPAVFLGGTAVAFTVLSLKNRVVDFRGLAQGDPSASLEADFMIGLKRMPTAPAADPDAFDRQSAKVVGAVRLPPGKLEPTVSRVGPVEFGGKKDRFIAFAVTWSAPFIGQELSEDGLETSINIVERTTGAIEKVTLKRESADDDFQLRIRNLSEADLNPVPGTRSRIDEDFAAHYVLAPQPDGSREVPQFEFAEFPTAETILATMGDLHGADETHLCSGAFMLPPPPEV